MPYSLSFASHLDASADDVWRVVGTMEGVNAELSPWLRMSTPNAAAPLRIEDAPIGRPMFASWLLLLGVVPIDRHALMLTEVWAGRGFHEDSTSWTQRRWQHRRTLEARGEHACTLTDRLDFTPRVRAVGPLLERIVRALFAHRHRRLRARFGGRVVRM